MGLQLCLSIEISTILIGFVFLSCNLIHTGKLPSLDFYGFFLIQICLKIHYFLTNIQFLHSFLLVHFFITVIKVVLIYIDITNQGPS